MTTETQRLTDKLNSGECFTDAELAWSQQNEPSLYNMIRGSGCQPAPGTTTPTTPSGSSSAETLRLTAKLNAGECFTDAEIAWARLNEPTLYNMIWGRSCQPAPGAQATQTPPAPGSCPSGYRKMSDSMKRGMIFDCPSAVAASILSQVAEAESKCLVRYEITFPGGYYLIENGVQYGAAGNCAEGDVSVPAYSPTVPVTPVTEGQTTQQTPTTPASSTTPAAATGTTPVSAGTGTTQASAAQGTTQVTTAATTTETGLFGLGQSQILMLVAAVIVVVVVIGIILTRRSA